jgi:uncharacterized protein (TIGR00369 family)
MTAQQPPPHRSEAEQRRLDVALTDLFERKVTFNHTLGLQVLRLWPGPTQFRFPMRPDLVGSYQFGRLHGGVISAALDAVAGMAMMVALTEKHCDESAEQAMHRFPRLGTIDLRIDYLRPGIGQHFVAGAEVIRLGGRVGTAQMRLINDQEQLIATGAAAYIVS